MEQKNNFISYKSWLNEEFISHQRFAGDIYEISINPYPNECRNEERFIGDKDGNLWMLKGSYGMVTHTQMLEVIRKAGFNLESPYRYEYEKEGSSLLCKDLITQIL